MTDMREKLASVLAEAMNGGKFSSNQHYNGDQKEVWHGYAKSILSALPDMIEPLVWEGSEFDCYLSCDMGTHVYSVTVTDTLERSCDYVWSASYWPEGGREQHISSLPQSNLEDAIEAANTHHRKQVMKAFGVEL